MSFAYRNSGADWIHRPTRLAIYSRDDFRCLACDREGDLVAASGLSLDHFVPKCEGGGNAPSNLVTLCIPCNSRRGERSIHWLAREIEIDEVAFMKRIRLALRKPIDRALGRDLCDVVWPGWRAAQNARKRNASPTGFEFGANAA